MASLHASGHAWHEPCQKTSRSMLDCHDVRRTEMDRKQQCVVLRASLQQAPARHRGIGRPLIRHVVPMRRVDLKRMMNDVAAEDGAPAAVRELEQDMARRM